MANNSKKYASLATLQTFLANLKNTFATLSHKHKISDLTDYTVDTTLSSTSSNPIANRTVDAEFEAIATSMNALDLAIDGKADASHNHDDKYFTETEIDAKLSSKSDTTHNHDSAYDTKGSASAVQSNLNTVSDTLDAHIDNTDIHVTTANKSNWSTAYTHSQAAHARTDATKVADSTTNGNILINGTETNVYSHPNSGVTAGTYKSVTVNAQGHITTGSNPTTLAGYGITDADPKGAADSALASAKTYADSAAAKVKNDLLNGAGGAYDTLKELGDLIDDNADAIDALETVAAGKADKTHSHAIADVTNLQSTLDGKAATSHGTHVSYSTTAPVMDGTASVGTASTVARSDHKHPTDTSRAAQTSLDSHTSDTTVHITSTERTNWNAAKTHADSAHAPSNAEKNQNAFSNVKVGTTTVAADTATDTITFEGSNVTITPDATNDKITFAVASGTTSAKGIVQLTNSTSSTSTTTAATPSSVKAAYDLANTAKTTADGKANASHTHTVANITDLTATAKELNYMDGVTSNVQTQLDGKSASGHTHNYAGSSSAGGAATSANKLNTDAGSATQPVYFSGGVPKATTYTLGKSVPSDAKFTDTTYSAATTSANGLMASTDKKKVDSISGTYSLGSFASKTVADLQTALDTWLNSYVSIANASANFQASQDWVTAWNSGNTATTISAGGTWTVTNIAPYSTKAYAQLRISYYSDEWVVYVHRSNGTWGTAHQAAFKDDLDSKQNTVTGGASTITGSNLTANRALISNGSGKVAVSAVTSTELGYLDGVTSNVQTQLDGKAASSHNHAASNITSGTLSSDRLPTVPIAKGGTGATTAAAALTSLGITATAAELNKMDGVTATTAELNYVDGVTSNIQTQLNGKAASSHTHNKDTINSVYDTRIAWGGESMNGSVSPVGAALSSEHSANRIAYLNPNALTFEYSDNGGSSWTAMSIADSTKIGFVTTSGTVGIGNASTVTTSHRTRVTLTAQNGTTGYVYTRPRKLLLNVSSAGHGISVTIETKTGVSGASWTTVGTYPLSGWSGWNDIPLSFSTLGGGTTQTSNIWYMRLTFATTSVNSSYTTTKSTVIGMRLFGDTCWTRTSNMGETGHLYSYDTAQNAIFPASISGSGSLSMNRESGTTVGLNSVAIGYNCESSAYCSYAEGDSTTASELDAHAEGRGTTASGKHSHAQGIGTTASGTGSHAEGSNTKAEGMYCHAEGASTVAKGYQTHAEGSGTIAAGSDQHVHGRYNVESPYQYATVVGNGSSSARSNMHTLDWSGNAWFKGNIYVGGTSQSNATALASVAAVTTAEYEALEETNANTLYMLTDAEEEEEVLITTDDIDTICGATV